MKLLSHALRLAALASAMLAIVAVTQASAQQMHANDSFDCPSGYILSGDGNYALFCTYGYSDHYNFYSDSLTWAYVGPGGAYEIWNSLWDGWAPALGTHQDQWALVSSPHALMQGNGDFVLYANGYSYDAWHTSTQGNSGAFLNPQTDGNLVLYTSGSSALWSVY
jgi:hypothetical protein